MQQLPRPNPESRQHRDSIHTGTQRVDSVAGRHAVGHLYHTPARLIRKNPSESAKQTDLTTLHDSNAARADEAAAVRPGGDVQPALACQHEYPLPTTHSAFPQPPLGYAEQTLRAH